MGESFLTVNEVVRLIIGGPEMYVEGPGTADGQVWCTFFYGRLCHGGSFDEKDLVRVNGKPRDFATPTP
jgi:uncharacterized protein YodC (DUF2158 family)